MKLVSALICLDCDEVFQAGKTETPCPACGSRTSWRLKKWIRPTQGVRAAVQKDSPQDLLNQMLIRAEQDADGARTAIYRRMLLCG
ncbi:hypothetical protein LJC22_06830 [Desulfosarcina sp. OttesenSCG-928-G10]|nr:hypothetical protein [Desulfosarcina sp. OttesenSCG-928-G10]MDL2320747.1 hypothetical protein [Desulfosarcina sp. OttesenSCG-928-B08]